VPGQEQYVNLEFANYDTRLKAFKFDLANLRGVKITRLFQDKFDISPTNYKVDRGSIYLINLVVNQREDSFRVYFETDSAKAKRQFNTAIIVAIIGCVGTISAAALPALLAAKRVTAEEPELLFPLQSNYALDITDWQYKFKIDWYSTKDDRQKFISPEVASTHDFWLGFRIKDDRVALQQSLIQGVHGPFPLRKGDQVSFDVPREFIKGYCEDLKPLQGVGLLVPKGRNLDASVNLANIPTDVVVIFSGSEVRDSQCAKHPS
jgi:hypothetical protein